MKNSGGKIHGWIPYKTMEHGARAKFHGFHGNITKGSMECKTMGSMGIYKNESMGSMVHSPHKIISTVCDFPYKIIEKCF